MTDTPSLNSEHFETDSPIEATSVIFTKYLNTSISTETKKILQPATQPEGISFKIRKGIKDDSVFHMFRVLIPLIVLGIMLMYILALIWYYRHRIVNVDTVDKKSQGSVCSRNSDDDNLRSTSDHSWFHLQQRKTEALQFGVTKSQCHHSVFVNLCHGSICSLYEDQYRQSDQCEAMSVHVDQCRQSDQCEAISVHVDQCRQSDHCEAISVHVDQCRQTDQCDGLSVHVDQCRQSDQCEAISVHVDQCRQSDQCEAISVHVDQCRQTDQCDGLSVHVDQCHHCFICILKS
ncbi:hypothetical protein Btru_055013 [Bulinus truncatus]|nr:hypothetical protein Btru_055013 [Bulinus truncatus]